MNFRKMKASDVPAVFRLGKKDFGKSTEYSWDWSKEGIRRYLYNHCVGFVCTERNSIIGFALAKKDYSSQKPGTAWLTFIFISRKYRHSKVGTRLLDFVISELKKSGKTDVITDVYSSNKMSLGFLKSNGFGKKEKWVVMRRKI